MQMHALLRLQPIGDSCGRKGIVDALLVGCIPVLFHECQRHLWQLNWGAWLSRGWVQRNMSFALCHTAQHAQPRAAIAHWLAGEAVVMGEARNRSAWAHKAATVALGAGRW